MKYTVTIFLLLTFTIVLNFAQSIDELGIEITTQDRQYVFTNKEAGTYYGEVNKQNSGGWQGWFINAEKILHDYSIKIRNQEPLNRESASSTVYPHMLSRKYSDRIAENFFITDSLNTLIIEVTHPFAELSLQVSDAFLKDTLVPSVSTFQRWIRRNSAPDFAPKVIVLRTVKKRNLTTFVVCAGSEVGETEKLAKEIANHSGELITQRKKRMQSLLDRSPVKFNDKNFTIALAWAKLQADALIMNQSTSGVRTKGIFAGLPWFNNYWGRDSFISLPGTTYLTGNFSDARDILLSYAKFQEIDSTNSNYGRIPNLATPQSVIYNTADGTPWFVKSMYEYVKYSNDTAIIRELYPVIVRSIEGTIKYHSDTLGFLTHGDAESWMDAVGPDGPWSPRGNRANDVQALWHQQLMIGAFCAEYLFEYGVAARWQNLANKLEHNFRTYFVDTTHQLLYDHLNPDNSPSTELRPNQLFCFDMAIPEDVRQQIVRTVLTELVYEHGTATLTQSDSNFHPFHEYPPYYVKDAAYHNGIVWTWLNGPMTYAATRYDLQEIIFPVTKNSVHQILNRGCVGALSELLDAHPRKNSHPSTPSLKSSSVAQDDYVEPKLSGTYSQAWSLAEFISSIYQDYLGVSVDVPSSILRINPKLPKKITNAEFTQKAGDGSFKISYKIVKEKVTISVTPIDISKKSIIDYLFVYPNGDAVLAPLDLKPQQTMKLIHTKNTLDVFHGKEKTISRKDDRRIFLKNFSDKKYFTDVTLAQPDANRIFRTLQGPSYPLLSHEQIKRKNSFAKKLFDQSDSIGDDKGLTGIYIYPKGINFKEGILDITNASIKYDNEFLYCSLSFNNLNNPGWHPEYGFQLTLAVIAINKGTGIQRHIGVNSNYILDTSRAFDRLIVIGGGIQIIDTKGKILCEYIPKQEDVKEPLGNTAEKKIEFSIPLEYLGMPSAQWKISILIGAQDDHGGAGVGEFRSVNAESGEWQGGGKPSPDQSNVYDELLINY